MSNEHEPERAALPDGAEKKAPADPHLRDHVLPTLVMRSPVAQLVVGPDQNLVLFNDRAGTPLGLSERDIGRQFSDLDASSSIVGLGPRTVAVLEGSKTVAMHEVRWLRWGTGAPTHVDVHMVPLIDGRNTASACSTRISLMRSYDVNAPRGILPTSISSPPGDASARLARGASRS